MKSRTTKYRAKRGSISINGSLYDRFKAKCGDRLQPTTCIEQALIAWLDEQEGKGN